MFWRFGFHNASAIDNLLNKEDVALEAILDEDDLLQECKAQNTRLIDYFQRVDVLQRLFAYVTGQIEAEEKGQFKYPYVATEVLCSDIWSIVETCVNEQSRLLVPFWETVLDRPPDDMKTHMVMASHFAKINSVFLTKKPAEMLAFIRSQPDVLERMIAHIETPSIVDLLIRIIQLDEHPGGEAVLDWLSQENLINRLVALLSPGKPPEIHAVVADLIKGIVSVAAPSPGTAVSEGIQSGFASNLFARELARKENISALLCNILLEFGPPSEEQQSGEEGSGAEDISSLKSQTLPNFDSMTSSVVHSAAVVIELIRKNNSDFFEPYMFHTLRNRLIQVQQNMHEDGRQALEQAMKEMVDRMGVVHLGTVLELMCDHMEMLKHYLIKPRSLAGPVRTTLGELTPLTLERYRLCELFAELLHCSNMSLLNRPAEHDHLYDSEGRLQGGLAALEELAQVISLAGGDERDNDAVDDPGDEVQPALELPISHRRGDSPTLDSDDDMSEGEPGSSDDDVMEEIVMYGDHHSQFEFSPPSRETALPSQPSTGSSPSDPSSSPPRMAEMATQTSPPSHSPSRGHGSNSSLVSPTLNGRRSSRVPTTNGDCPGTPLVIGEKLKKRFLEVDVLRTLLDLFLEFPWNNFLHSAVYDVIHQILTGHVESGYNRELVISLFRDARIMHKIVQGQKMNDASCAQPKGVRLGYMGHLTLIAEDVIMALERFPPDLRLIMIQYAPEPEWDEYVTGKYQETRKRDSTILGGGKPAVSSSEGSRNVSKWKVDEGDVSPLAADSGEAALRSEFRRSTSISNAPRANTADFGPAPRTSDNDDSDDEDEGRNGLSSYHRSFGRGHGADDDDDDPNTVERQPAPHFAHYLAQEMHSFDHFGSESDDEDDEGGWLSQSTFSLGSPPVSARHQSTERRPLSNSGFDDAFVPREMATKLAEDPFNPNDDDGFGPFADSHATSSRADPFGFSSFSDEMDDPSFDGFGDFGEFQSAPQHDDNRSASLGGTAEGGTEGAASGGSGARTGDGDLTPTTGSWTFASADSSTSDDAGSEGSGHLVEFGSPNEEKRVPASSPLSSSPAAASSR